jgi:hypothetical protein
MKARTTSNRAATATQTSRLCLLGLLLWDGLGGS